METFETKRPAAFENRESVFDKISRHSEEFDSEIARTRIYPEKEIEGVFRQEEWKVGEGEIKAIGVMHVPETFLSFRPEIERAIGESDLVVNEFAPEALGMYSHSQREKLGKARSRFNGDYDLEQLRQEYLKCEREIGIGTFHHEIELLAAKYGKDMACIDLTATQDPEQALQKFYLYQEQAEKTAKSKQLFQQFGLFGMAAGIGWSATRIKGGKEGEPKMTRRAFIKKMAVLGTAGAIAAATPGLTKVSLTPKEKLHEEIDDSKDALVQDLRNAYLAEALRRLTELGYGKVAFVYGVRHLESVKKYLDDPDSARKKLTENEGLVNSVNGDPFRVFELSPGENDSERFTASENLVWKRK